MRLTDGQRTAWTDKLTIFYRKAGMKDDEIQPLIMQKLAECEAGWLRAPHDMDQRIARKTGYREENGPIQTPFSPQPKQNASVANGNPGGNRGTIRDSLCEEERLWWDDRMKQYIEEFEFNRSSDMIILEQIMVEEVLQRRLSIEQLQRVSGFDPVLSKTQSESLKRLLDLQTKLGITREQRETSMNQIDGNIATIAVALDEKKAEILKQAQLDAEEETEFSSEKAKEIPINPLPPMEKLAAIVGVGEQEVALMPAEPKPTTVMTISPR